MLNRKFLALAAVGALSLSLVACNGTQRTAVTEPSDIKIVLNDITASATTGVESSTAETSAAAYEFKPLKFELIRDYYADQDGDNFPVLKVKVLKDTDMHQYPDAGSALIKKLSKDTEVFIAQNFENGWSFVHQDKDSGFVKSEDVDQAAVKGVKNPKGNPKGEMQKEQPKVNPVNESNFKSSGKKTANRIFWKGFEFPFQNVSDFNYGNPNVFYGEPASQMIYKQIGPSFNPYDGKCTYIDGHRHMVAYNMWANNFGVGEEIEVTDANGNAYKYKVVELKQEHFLDNNGYIAATFSNGTGVLDAFNFGTPYESVIIQYCNDANTYNPLINFFLCLPVLDNNAGAN